MKLCKNWKLISINFIPIYGHLNAMGRICVPQLSIWLGMGEPLYHTYPTCDTIVHPMVGSGKGWFWYSIEEDINVIILVHNLLRHPRIWHDISSHHERHSWLYTIDYHYTLIIHISIYVTFLEFIFSSYPPYDEVVRSGYNHLYCNFVKHLYQFEPFWKSRWYFGNLQWNLT
jgi:hypothetical protein